MWSFNYFVFVILAWLEMITGTVIVLNEDNDERKQVLTWKQSKGHRRQALWLLGTVGRRQPMRKQKVHSVWNMTILHRKIRWLGSWLQMQFLGGNGLPRSSRIPSEIRNCSVSIEGPLLEIFGLTFSSKNSYFQPFSVLFLDFHFLFFSVNFSNIFHLFIFQVIYCILQLNFPVSTLYFLLFSSSFHPYRQGNNRTRIDNGIKRVDTADRIPSPANTVRIPTIPTSCTIGKLPSNAAIATIDMANEFCAERWFGWLMNVYHEVRVG